MKNRLMRTVTCALVAGALTVPMSAGAASAATSAARNPAAVKPAVDPATVIAILQKVYSIYQQYFGGSGLTLQTATTEILDAIESAKEAITDQIDLVAAADVQACANATVVEFADMQAMTPDTLQNFAMDATSCTTEADSLLETVTDQGAIDELGYAVNTVGPLAMIARVYAGLTTPALRSVLIDADNAVVNRMITDADCTWYQEGDDDVIDMTCTAYDGTVGYASSVGHQAGNPIHQKLYDEAMTNASINTSRPLAVQALMEI